MYKTGKAVTQNYTEAVKWYTKAAEQGLATAQNNLGVMCEKGQGVPQNYVFAYRWYCLAAAQGNSTATTNHDKLAEKMTPAQIAEAQKLASEWKTKQ
jgi:hypothetical protein